MRDAAALLRIMSKKYTKASVLSGDQCVGISLRRIGPSHDIFTQVILRRFFKVVCKLCRRASKVFRGGLVRALVEGIRPVQLVGLPTDAVVLTKGQLKRVIVPGWSQCAKVVVHAQRAPPPQICLATEARLDVAKEVLVRPTLLGRS
jgi:hypothetical protein